MWIQLKSFGAFLGGNIIASGRWVGEKIGINSIFAKTPFSVSLSLSIEEFIKAVNKSNNFPYHLAIHTLFQQQIDPKGKLNFNQLIDERKTTAVLKQYQLIYENEQFILRNKTSNDPHLVQNAIITTEALFHFMQKISAHKNELGQFYQLMLRDLYNTLVRPHCDSVKSVATEDELLALNIIQGKCRDRRHDEFKREASKIKDLEETVIFTQRTFLKNRYIKKQKANPEPVKSAEWLKENLPKNYKQYRLDINPPLPKINRAINKELAKQWIDQHPERSKSLAKKLVQSITHRSFKKFDKNLRLSVRSFNATMVSLPKDNRSYVIILPKCYFGDNSNSWVASLALKYLDAPPKAILFTEEAKDFFADDKNKSVKHALLLDDAMYSGKQFTSESLGNVPPSVTEHIVVPFITIIAHRLISKNVIVHRYERMLTVKEIGLFTDEELEYMDEQILNHSGSSCSRNVSNRTLTFFDHKIADDTSTLPSILEMGRTIEGEFTKHSFIPEAPTPYKRKHLNLE